jgi:hypothetical protein
MNTPNQQPAPVSRQPVFRSQPLENSPAAMVLWGGYENNKPHITGKLTVTSPDGQLSTLNISGFFKINEKGEVQLPLSSRIGNEYASIGTIYIQRGNLRFYPKDRTQPQLQLEATNTLPLEVAEAIGVNHPLAQQQAQPPQDAAPSAQASVTAAPAPQAAAAQPLAAPQQNHATPGVRPRFNG